MLHINHLIRKFHLLMSNITVEVLNELFNDIPHVDSLSCLFNEIVLTNEEEPENYSDSDEQSDNFELESLSEDELNLE